MGSIIFQTKLSALMKLIQKKKIFGKVSAFVWRIEYQRRSLPHAHILFWNDFDTQDVHAVETVINVRNPKDSPFPDDEGMVTNFRQLIDLYEIRHHVKRCCLPSGKCRLGCPQTTYERTRICGHNYLFARDDQENFIVPHNPSLLAYFRCHHCLEVIHSEQCIGYVLKHCSQNPDAGCVSVFYEAYSVTRSDKLHCYAATRISSASECFAGIFGNRRHDMKPTVQILGMHLPGKKIVLTAWPADAVEKLDIRSPLERYLGCPTDISLDQLTYL
jgi:hypothetical protein